MSQLSLDAIFTALTCLSSSDYSFKPAFINSRTPVYAENYTLSCQLQAFEVLNAKIAQQQQQISQLARDMHQMNGMMRLFKVNPLRHESVLRRTSPK